MSADKEKPCGNYRCYDDYETSGGEKPQPALAFRWRRLKAHLFGR